jgi:hypothetical protein
LPPHLCYVGQHAFQDQSSSLCKGSISALQDVTVTAHFPRDFFRTSHPTIFQKKMAYLVSACLDFDHFADMRSSSQR